MITEDTVSKVLPADPHAMRGVDITVPRWDNIKSGGKYQIPYTNNRKYSKIIYLEYYDIIFEWLKVTVRCSYIFVPRNSSIGSWNMSQVCATKQSARLH